MNLPDPDAPLCASGKRPFRTEELALQNLRRATYLRRHSPGYKPGRVESGVYECPTCDWWHLTSAPNKRTRRGDYGDRDLSPKKRRRR